MSGKSLKAEAWSMLSLIVSIVGTIFSIIAGGYKIYIQATTINYVFIGTTLFVLAFLALHWFFMRKAKLSLYRYRTLENNHTFTFSIEEVGGRQVLACRIFRNVKLKALHDHLSTFDFEMSAFDEWDTSSSDLEKQMQYNPQARCENLGDINVETKCTFPVFRTFKVENKLKNTDIRKGQIIHFNESQKSVNKYNTNQEEWQVFRIRTPTDRHNVKFEFIDCPIKSARVCSQFGEEPKKDNQECNIKKEGVRQTVEHTWRGSKVESRLYLYWTWDVSTFERIKT